MGGGWQGCYGSGIGGSGSIQLGLSIAFRKSSAHRIAAAFVANAP
jgi:hypothetical protein